MSRVLSFESIPAEMFERESSDCSTEPWGDYLSQTSYKETMISSQVLSDEGSEHLDDFVSVASFQSGSEDVYGTPPRSLTFGGFIKQKPLLNMWSYDSIPEKIFSSQPMIPASDEASTYLNGEAKSSYKSQSTLGSGRTISAELIPRADTFSAFEEPSAISYKLSFGSIPKENMKPNFVSRSPLDESDQQPQDPGPKVPIVWSNCICCVTVEIMCHIYETCLAICNR
ncbi:Protein CBG28028 [Caenorhabditis briggsae]|uniref:Protein CBG28028 n=1 Tax=Caenorhabditis briggsae TaxID=6238 RepID=B6IG24_CAEBR|nr:Protein CBG28028 [Caenorhabditis briggsae]CAR98854.1 Protein CBG28028 [Caenorhabditis briggsae]